MNLISATLRGYKRWVSPVLHAGGLLGTPGQCIYQPTCSEYAEIAIARFGTVRGSAMATRRILRCNPLAKGGLDPVPERK